MRIGSRSSSLSFCKLIFAAVLLATVAALAGCGNSSNSSVGPITGITLNPQPTVSLTSGDVLQMSVNATDAHGRPVLNQTFTFNLTVTTPGAAANAIQVADAGQLCGGTWDSLSSPVNCTPANPGAGGIQGNLSVTAGGVTSNTVRVFVHEKIVSLSAVLVAGSPACVSQAGTQKFVAVAKDAAGNDITNSLGTVFWSIAGTDVGTLSSTTTANPQTVTAVQPGITTVTVSANSINLVNSVPAVFEECPVASITLAGPISLSGTGATQTITATVTDTLGAVVSKPVLTWSATAPAVATVVGSGSSAPNNAVVTALLPGTGGVVASCMPNACNINLSEPVYSNLLTANVPGASSSTVYVTCSVADAACPASSVPLVAVNVPANTVATTITLPAPANSMVFDEAGDHAFLGSASGLMILDPATNVVTSPVTNAKGAVLAVSPSGNGIILSTAQGGTTPAAGGVILYNVSANAVLGEGIPNAFAAAFTPDGFKSFILSESPCAGGALPDCLYSITAKNAVSGVGVTATGVAAMPGAPASQQLVAILTNGAAGYLAGSGVPFFATCAPSFGSADSGQTPSLIAALPDGSAIVGANGAASVLDNIAVTVTPNVSNPCAPGISNAATSIALGASYTPTQIIVTPDSKHVYITSNLAGKLLRADIGGASTSISFANAGAVPTTGGAAADSSTVYIGASDNSLHVISTSSGTETTTVPVSVTPDLVAIRP